MIRKLISHWLITITLFLTTPLFGAFDDNDGDGYPSPWDSDDSSASIQPNPDAVVDNSAGAPTTYKGAPVFTTLAAALSSSGVGTDSIILIREGGSDYTDAGVTFADNGLLIISENGPENTVFTGNGTHNNWGVQVNGNSVAIVGITLKDYHATWSGPAIGVYGNDAFVYNCIIKDSHSTANGGAIYSSPSSSTTFRNSLIINNTSDQKGGGIYNQGPITFEHCTIFNNSAMGGSPQIHVHTASNYAKNSIIWDNGGAVIAFGSNLVVSDSIINPGYAVTTAGIIITDDPQLDLVSGKPASSSPAVNPTGVSDIGVVIGINSIPRSSALGGDGQSDIGAHEYFDFDSDNDGLEDAWELKYAVDLTVLTGHGDNDVDHITNIGEYKLGTNPLVWDDLLAYRIAYESCGERCSGHYLLWSEAGTSGDTVIKRLDLNSATNDIVTLYSTSDYPAGSSNFPIKGIALDTKTSDLYWVDSNNIWVGHIEGNSVVSPKLLNNVTGFHTFGNMWDIEINPESTKLFIADVNGGILSAKLLDDSTGTLADLTRHSLGTQKSCLAVSSIDTASNQIKVFYSGNDNGSGTTADKLGYATLDVPLLDIPNHANLINDNLYQLMGDHNSVPYQVSYSNSTERIYTATLGSVSQAGIQGGIQRGSLDGQPLQTIVSTDQVTDFYFDDYVISDSAGNSTGNLLSEADVKHVLGVMVDDSNDVFYWSTQEGRIFRADLPDVSLTGFNGDATLISNHKVQLIYDSSVDGNGPVEIYGLAEGCVGLPNSSQ